HEPALETDREPAVWRHAVGERLQVRLERGRLPATCGGRGDGVVVTVQAVASRDQLGAAKQQGERTRRTGPRVVGGRVERALDHRVAGHEQELAVVLASGPRTEPAFALRR